MNRINLNIPFHDAINAIDKLLNGETELSNHELACLLYPHLDKPTKKHDNEKRFTVEVLLHNSKTYCNDGYVYYCGKHYHARKKDDTIPYNENEFNPALAFNKTGELLWNEFSEWYITNERKRIISFMKADKHEYYFDYYAFKKVSNNVVYPVSLYYNDSYIVGVNDFGFEFAIPYYKLEV